MFLKRIVVLGAMIAASIAWARPEVRSSAPTASLGAAAAPTADNSATSSGRSAIVPNGDRLAFNAGNQGNLEPRKPLPKPKTVERPQGNSMLYVKFADTVKARATAERSVRTARLEDADPINAIAQQFNVQFEQAIKRSEQDIRTLEQRAEVYSGKAQPDLAGMMIITGQEQSLEAAAKALLALDIVEFVYFEPELRPNFGPPPTGACLVPDPLSGVPDCQPDTTEAACTGAGGCYLGDDTTCDITCGDGAICGELGCCTVHIPPTCNDEECCDLVCGIRPFCCDQILGTWDEVCVEIAHLVCPLNAGWPFQDCPNRCMSVLNGECFEPNAIAGCNDEACCTAVCNIDAFCCDFFWDDICVDLAFQECLPPCGFAGTPDFVPLQGYLRTSTYANQPGGMPGGPCGNLCGPAAAEVGGSIGFGSWFGQGSNLFASSVLADDPSLPAPERYQGLYGLGRDFVENYDVGTQNLARGKTIKVAVIEWAYYQGHEDLDVIDEPGQTLIMTPDTEPDHATACLGIIGGEENGFGITGIAPDCQLYFFPLTSVEEGPRFATAFFNAYNTLGPGDIVSCSFGPGGPIYNLNNSLANWPLIRLGSDLGITTCISAGNDCANLDTAPDLGDSGAVVVGACFPGQFFCRIPFSNYFSGGDDGVGGNSNVVHCSAWGTCVTSTGYGNLWLPNDDNLRSYTNSFGGTSAAAPQIAGMAACLQGFAKQFYGIPLAPFQMRAILQTGYAQCGFSNPDDLWGFDESAPCGTDSNDDFGPNKIGRYTEPRAAAGTMLTQTIGGFDDSPLIDDITLIRGTHLFGNVFSIKGQDDMYYTASSLWTPRNHRPDLPSPASQVRYIASGQTVDIMVHAHVLSISQQLGLITEIQPPGPQVFYLAEMFDWTIGKWAFVDFMMITGGGNGGCVVQGGVNDNPLDLCFVHEPVLNGTRFIRPHDLQVRIRLYYVAPGIVNAGNGGEPDNFVMRVDWVGLSAGGAGAGGAGP